MDLNTKIYFFIQFFYDNLGFTILIKLPMQYSGEYSRKFNTRFIHTYIVCHIIIYTLNNIFDYILNCCAHETYR